jgi:hypothetical protein
MVLDPLRDPGSALFLARKELVDLILLPLLLLPPDQVVGESAGWSRHAAHPTKLESLLKLLLRLQVQPVTLRLLFNERDKMIFGLAKLLVGTDTEAVENSEVDLADSPRVSPVRLWTRPWPVGWPDGNSSTAGDIWSSSLDASRRGN